tara:strand:- start:1368 stop:2948 length:1581 start_codon:yes stop_codon:yes gene_type:complete
MSFNLIQMSAAKAKMAAAAKKSELAKKKAAIAKQKAIQAQKSAITGAVVGGILGTEKMIKEKQKAKAKARLKRGLTEVGKIYPYDHVLSKEDQMRKATILSAAQGMLGRPKKTSKRIEELKRKAARKVVGAKLSTPARRAELRLKARKDAQERIRKLAMIRKRRRLTPQEVLRLKTDTEAILGVAVPPKDVHRKGMSFLAPKARPQKLWKKPHMRKRFPRGARPVKVRQLIGVMQENNLISVSPEVAEPVLKALIPKIRSRKASPMSVARILKSQQAKRLAEARKRRAFRKRKTSPYHRQQVKRFDSLMAKLKLMQKRLRTLERMQKRFVQINDQKEASIKSAEVAHLQTQIAAEEATILTEAINEAPEVKNLVEDGIAISLAEADLEDAAEEMAEPTEAEVLIATDAGQDAAFVADSQVASLLDEAAATIDDAVPAVVAEADTPAIDPEIIETLETEQGQELDPEDIYELADSVSVQLADEMITEGAKVTGTEATKDQLLTMVKDNLPVILIGGLVGYYVLFAKK